MSTILQRLARVPLPSGPWGVSLGLRFDGVWNAQLCDGASYIVVEIGNFEGAVETDWVMENRRLTLTPYRMRQARAWANAVERAAKGSK